MTSAVETAVRPARISAGAADYAQLKRLVADRGLLERHPLRYVPQALALTLMIAGVAAGIGLFRGSWWVLVWAAPAAFLFGQLGFLAHEAEHNQILRSSRRNHALGLFLFDLCLGGSAGWWAEKHNLHHAQPNRLGVDPDIDGGPIAVSPIQLPGITGVGRWITRHQASAIWGLLPLEGFLIRLQTAGFLLRQSGRKVILEAVLLLVHNAAYAAGLILVLGVGRGLLFALVHQLLLGAYLGLAFLPNHTGMAVLERDEEMDFLRRQVLTARNLRAHPVTDYVTGVLSCQIEHHLFPRMPRSQLRRAAPLVRGFCEARGIAYRETGAFEAYADIYRHLRKVALPLRGRVVRAHPDARPGSDDFVNLGQVAAGSVTVDVSPSPDHEDSTVEYALKLIKVGGETRWALHDGRKVVGKLFETYGQAAAERTRVQGREAAAAKLEARAE
jgi:fatty acid desaturase